VATSPIRAVTADSKNTNVKDPSASAIQPPMGGEIICATPNTKVAAAKLAP
jgi:hypothetical protein